MVRTIVSVSAEFCCRVSSASATATEPRGEKQMENNVVPNKALQIRRLNSWFLNFLGLGVSIWYISL